MRWWTLFLALYVLVLSGLPCDDSCQDKPLPTAAQTSAPTPDDHPHGKACSPFSQCLTCTGFTVPSPLHLEVATPWPSPLVVVLASYHAPYTLEVGGRIWQPPQGA